MSHKPLSIDDLKIDFLRDHLHYQRKSHRGKQEIIAKALGAAKGIKQVIDLTCGLAEDAFFLAQIGFSVKALERCEPIYKVLIASYNKAKLEEPEHPALSRLEIHFENSVDFLKSPTFLQAEPAAWALYLDPMFPEKKKTALPRKEMQIFRSIVGPDLDSAELFEAAMQSGAARVVVKRPIRAEAVAPGVIHTFEGNTVRYDLYVPSPR